MRASSALLAALAVVSATTASAHRREDYLQAARIGLATERVRITLDLTPGLAVAESFIAALDHDRDGSLSAGEQRRYTERMAGALEVTLDHASVPVRLASGSFPDLAAFRSGEGTIRVTMEATLPRTSAGSHRLRFRNAHLSGHSAYLANALVPESAGVSVTAQTRTRDQSELTIEYTVREPAAAAGEGPREPVSFRDLRRDGPASILGHFGLPVGRIIRLEGRRAPRLKTTNEATLHVTKVEGRDFPPQPDPPYSPHIQVSNVGTLPEGEPIVVEGYEFTQWVGDPDVNWHIEVSFHVTKVVAPAHLVLRDPSKEPRAGWR